MVSNKKIAPTRFKGTIEIIPINKLLEYISFTCFFTITNKNNEAVLFFKDGQIINARINEEYGINKFEEILTWGKGNFYYQKLDKFFNVDIKYLKDVLFFVELIKGNCELDISFNKNIGLIIIENGKIKKIKINGKSDNEALTTILKTNKGSIKYRFIKSNKKTIKKTDNMNVKKINESIEILKEDLGDALIASVIWSSSDGQSIASYNPQPKAAALFNTVTNYINKSLTDSGFPGLSKYYMLDLDADSLILVIILEDFQWGMLVNSNKIQLGLLLNIAMPRAREAFIEAIK